MSVRAMRARTSLLMRPDPTRLNPKLSSGGQPWSTKWPACTDPRPEQTLGGRSMATDGLSGEDRRLAGGLRQRARGGEQRIDAGQRVGAEPAAGRFLVVHDNLTAQAASLEQLLSEAEQITICGVAGPALIMALEKIARNMADISSELPWEELHYITPDPSIM